MGKASTSANCLNNIALPSITGIAALRAKCSKPEYGTAAIGNNRRLYQSSACRRYPHFMDSHTYSGNIGRVHAGQNIPVLDRRFGLHLDFAAEMKQKCAIRHVNETHTSEILHPRNNTVQLGLFGCGYRNVFNRPIRTGLNDINRDNLPTVFRNNCDQLTEVDILCSAAPDVK